MNITRPLLRASWHSWVSTDKPRAGPYWLQLLWTAVFIVGLAQGFTAFGFVVWANSPRPS